VRAKQNCCAVSADERISLSDLLLSCSN